MFLLVEFQDKTGEIKEVITSKPDDLFSLIHSLDTSPECVAWKVKENDDLRRSFGWSNEFFFKKVDKFSF